LPGEAGAPEEAPGDIVVEVCGPGPAVDDGPSPAHAEASVITDAPTNSKTSRTLVITFISTAG
jgi:hypothetical protein